MGPRSHREGTQVDSEPAAFSSAGDVYTCHTGRYVKRNVALPLPRGLASEPRLSSPAGTAAAGSARPYLLGAEANRKALERCSAWICLSLPVADRLVVRAMKPGLRLISLKFRLREWGSEESTIRAEGWRPTDEFRPRRRGERRQGGAGRVSMTGSIE
jgi:hypothetical protein